jgi:hypothetical protein
MEISVLGSLLASNNKRSHAWKEFTQSVMKILT